MKNVTLVRASKDWKDRAAGWHTWSGLSTCPTCGKEFRDTLSGTQQQALAWQGECPACDALEYGIDCTGQRFEYDTQPLPLLNPGLV